MPSRPLVLFCFTIPLDYPLRIHKLGAREPPAQYPPLGAGGLDPRPWTNHAVRHLNTTKIFSRAMMPGFSSKFW